MSDEKGDVKIHKFADDDFVKLINAAKAKSGDEGFCVKPMSFKADGVVKEYLALTIMGMSVRLVLSNVSIFIDGKKDDKDNPKPQSGVELSKLPDKIAEALLELSAQKAKALARFGKTPQGKAWNFKKIYKAIKTTKTMQIFDDNGDVKDVETPVERVFLNAPINLNTTNSSGKMIDGTTFYDMTNVKDIFSNPALTPQQKLDLSRQAALKKTFDTQEELTDFTGRLITGSITYNVGKITPTKTPGEFSTKFKVISIAVNEISTTTQDTAPIDEELMRLARHFRNNGATDDTGDITSFMKKLYEIKDKQSE